MGESAWEVLVVGAGPAGLAAASTVGRYDLQVLLVEEQPRGGGQFWRWRWGETPPGSVTEALASLSPQGRFLPSARVWGLFEGRRVVWEREGRSEWVEPRAVIVATGAYDLVFPFPGWTLPGVLTLGGAQALLKEQGLSPGQQVVVAGTGPLLALLAYQLLEAGAKVLGVVEMASWWDGVMLAWHLLRMPPHRHEVLQVWRALRRARVPFFFRHRVVEAEGEERVRGVRIRPCAPDGSLLPGEGRRWEADALCIGYGWVAHTFLSRMAGCQHRWQPEAGGWVVVCDEWQRASQPGFYAAGEVTGVGGALKAQAEGMLAGLAVAMDQGRLPSSEAESLARPLRRRLRSLQPWLRLLRSRFFRPRPGLWQGCTGDTVVCRCEEVSYPQWQRAFHEGARSCNSIKALTRCGMGLCQGRFCEPLLQQWLRGIGGIGEEVVGSLTVRPPLHPLPVGAILEAREYPG